MSLNYTILGIGGIVWFLLWILMVSNSPASHPRISSEERDYIETSIASESGYKSKKVGGYGGEGEG